MDGEQLLSLFLYKGPLIAYALIIGACVFGVCFCCCFIYCLWSCYNSEDHEKNQVVPVSIIETY